MSMAVAVGFFLRSMHVSEQKFNVRNFKTMRLDECYRLVVEMGKVVPEPGPGPKFVLTRTSTKIFSEQDRDQNLFD
jgi:hypothetical protein